MNINIVIELLCFLISVISLYTDQNIMWRLSILYLLITCITEITGVELKSAHLHNQWVYNIFIIFEAAFTTLMFANILKTYRYAKLTFAGCLSLLGAVYIYETAFHGFLVFNNLMTTVMSILFVVYSLFYFYQLLKNEQPVKLIFLADFWWVTGVLFFYFGSTACDIFYERLANVKIYAKQDLVHFIFRILIILLYTFWSYSFICRRWLMGKSEISS